ncbi:TlpA family protein disulfide reductase [Magnetovibrio blakemorei]|uniref:Thioredoxin domain-containing protein n=1 Tax=Magnetovibrio blakemorei TaxID=28181 RepID=A0A1E5Q6R5_9PROT|nr:TlpA disulfide reductase family protein [Magnetovibrio blakemorei]OEJ66703.1 hypothetical protein BEN30_11520 [Magnetovibrio blakemorei]
MTNKLTILALIFAALLAFAPPSWAAGNHPAQAGALMDARLTDIHGKVHTLSEWKGKVIMLNFFATWCAPCQAEIRDLKKWHKAHKTEGLQVIGVGLDDPHKLSNFANSLEIPYPVLTSGTAGSAIMAAWGNALGEVPYTVIIAPDGSIPYVQRGTFSEAALNRFVVPLLK